MAKIVAERLMPISVKKLWNVILAFEDYPNFLKEVISTKVEKKGKLFLVEFEIELLKRFKYTLEFSTTPFTEITWKLVEGELFKTNSGKWVLKEKTKNQTLAIYETEVTFGFFVPNWVIKKLTEVNLPAMLEAFERRALMGVY